MCSLCILGVIAVILGYLSHPPLILLLVIASIFCFKNKTKIFWIIIICGVSFLRGQIVANEDVINAKFLLPSNKSAIWMDVIQVSGEKITMLINNRKFLCKVSSEDIHTNDKILASANFEYPSSFSENFNYPLYLQKDKIVGLCTINKIETILSKQQFFSLLDIRTNVLQTMKRLWTIDSYGFISGILIGQKSEVPKDLSNIFKSIGLSHVLVLSGFNITIVALFFVHIFRFLPRKQRLYVALCGVWIFILFVGGEAPLIRAGLMGSFVIYAKIIERESNIWIAFTFSIFILTFTNPLTPIVDIGFQLSITALLGLLLGVPAFKHLFLWTPKKFGIQEILTTSFACQIWTLPIMLYYFGNFSLISLLANLLITPWVPYLMLMGAISTIVTIFGGFFGIGLICAKITEVFSSTLLYVAKELAEVPFASIHLPITFTWYHIAIMYITLIMYYFYRIKLAERK